MTADTAGEELEALFAAEYPRVARLIARVIRDPGRAEELAVEVFLRYAKSPVGPGGSAGAWLSRAAARAALDELRAQTRRRRYEPLLRLVRTATPEEIHSANEEQERVRAVLGRMAPRQAELLLLRSEGLRYEELAEALGLHAPSVGSLLSRAQQTFRKEYVERYGTESC